MRGGADQKVVQVKTAHRSTATGSQSSPSLTCRLLAMSIHNESYQSLSQWDTRPNGEEHTTSDEQFQQFAESYPGSDDCPFLPARGGVSSIQTNPQVMEKSYFHSYCPGLNANVPIPLHPELVGMPDTTAESSPLTYPCPKPEKDAVLHPIPLPPPYMQTF